MCAVKVAPGLLLLTRNAQALRPELRPALVFDNRPRDAPRYELRAMVCYYGSHYAAYARTDEGSGSSLLPSTCVCCFAASRCGSADACSSRPDWSRFDDASVARVGSWEAVCDACARGHLQPTVLFYERPEAPKTQTYATR